MAAVETLQVTEDEEGMRLDRWFKRRVPALSLSHLNKAVAHDPHTHQVAPSVLVQEARNGIDDQAIPRDEAGERAAQARGHAHGVGRAGVAQHGAALAVRFELDGAIGDGLAGRAVLDHEVRAPTQHDAAGDAEDAVALEQAGGCRRGGGVDVGGWVGLRSDLGEGGGCGGKGCEAAGGEQDGAHGRHHSVGQHALRSGGLC